jgi:hypothetical protein
MLLNCTISHEFYIDTVTNMDPYTAYSKEEKCKRIILVTRQLGFVYFVPFGHTAVSEPSPRCRQMYMCIICFRFLNLSHVSFATSSTPFNDLRFDIVLRTTISSIHVTCPNNFTVPSLIRGKENHACNKQAVEAGRVMRRRGTFFR